MTRKQKGLIWFDFSLFCIFFGEIGDLQMDVFGACDKLLEF